MMLFWSILETICMLAVAVSVLGNWFGYWLPHNYITLVMIAVYCVVKQIQIGR
jgi:hypothetical protein